MMRVLKLDACKDDAVLAGTVPAIYALPCGTKNVDARHKAGHDDAERVAT